MSIKISAYPDAPLPMGASDLVTGLQGGENVNFSQAQILTGQDGVTGNSIDITGGNGTAGLGGGVFAYGGTGDGVGGNGGSFVGGGGYALGTGNGGFSGLYAGAGSGSSGLGGKVSLVAGNTPVNGNGGQAYITGGDGSSGGYIFLNAGNAHDTGSGGSIRLTLGLGGANNGYLEIVNANSVPGSSAGTLTNAPAAGNPQFWLQVLLNGDPYFIPAWHP